MDAATARPTTALVVVTQALLAIICAIGVAAVALLPGLSAYAAEQAPEYAELQIPLLALCIAFVLLALIGLAMVMLLVHRIYRGTILDRTSLLWVDVIVTVLVLAVVITVSMVVAIDNAQAGSPFLAIVFGLSLLGMIVLACITLVLRSLLRHAIVMRAELDEVV